MKAQLLEDIGNNHAFAPPPRPSARTSAPQQPAQQQPGPSEPPPSPAWTGPQIEEEARYGNSNDADAGDWFDRWGRTAAIWLAVLLTALLLSGTGMWLYNENKLDTTLQVLAKAPIPARQAKLAPVPAQAQSQAPAPAPAEAASTAAAAAIASEPQRPSPGPAQVPELPAPPAPAGGGAATGVAPAPAADAAAPVAAAAPSTPTRAAKKGAPAQAREQERLAAAKAGRGEQLSETLRLCRAAGYHAARCVQLGCEATKYGLACKGSSGKQ